MPNEKEKVQEQSGSASNGLLSDVFDSTEGQWSTCEWEYDDEQCRWGTECERRDAVFHLVDSPIECGFKFCPFCGKPVREM